MIKKRRPTGTSISVVQYGSALDLFHKKYPRFRQRINENRCLKSGTTFYFISLLGTDATSSHITVLEVFKNKSMDHVIKVCKVPRSIDLDNQISYSSGAHGCNRMGLASVILQRLFGCFTDPNPWSFSPQ